MDILDELRQQKTACQDNTDTSTAAESEDGAYQQSRLPAYAKKIHDFLYELSSNLNQLEHAQDVEMHLPELGTISNLYQNNYELLWENRASQNRVTLNFTTHIKDTCPIDLAGMKKTGIEDQLSAAGVDYAITDEGLILNGAISSSLSFSMNPNNANISLKISNFKQLGSYRYSVDAKLIDKTFFDQLGRFLLHRENNFIEIISSPDSALNETNVEDYPEDSGVHTQEMDVSRVRSLFSREVQLYLTYHNTIKEINPKSGDFVLGRSRQCNMNINSDLASRQHAKIVYRKGKYVLIDQSTNGTFVKTQGGKEVYVQGEELPLSGSGFISLGKSVTVDNEHIIYFSCQ